MEGDHNRDSQGSEDAHFTTTHWSVVFRASEPEGAQTQDALACLCRNYWYPLYAFVRRRGYGPEEAQDLTQGFFARFLEKEDIRQADRQRGRFRTFLLSSLQHFLANAWDRQHAAKRGGQCAVVSWDELQAEQRYRQETTGDLSAERLYDRRWAVALIDHVLAELQAEYAGRGETELFDALAPHLTGQALSVSTSALAARFQMGEGALRMRLHRLRRRFGDRLRAHVARTVNQPQDVEDELRYLIGLWDSS